MAVYEIFDATDDHMHFSLGLYETLDEAIVVVDGLGDSYANDWAQDYDEIIEIRERGFGWGDNDKVVCRIERCEVAGDSDTYKMEIVSATFPGREPMTGAEFASLAKTIRDNGSFRC